MSNTPPLAGSDCTPSDVLPGLTHFAAKCHRLAVDVLPDWTGPEWDDWDRKAMAADRHGKAILHQSLFSTGERHEMALRTIRAEAIRLMVAHSLSAPPSLPPLSNGLAADEAAQWLIDLAAWADGGRGNALPDDEEEGNPPPTTPAESEWTVHCGGGLLASPDFGTVRRIADGRDFPLRPKERLVVRHMVEVFVRTKRNSFTGDELLKIAGSDAAELRSVFRSNGNPRPAWKDLVAKVAGEDNRYTLNLQGGRQPG